MPWEQNVLGVPKVQQRENVVRTDRARTNVVIGEFAEEQSDIPDTILKTVRRGQLWKHGKQQGSYRNSRDIWMSTCPPMKHKLCGN